MDKLSRPKPSTSDEGAASGSPKRAKAVCGYGDKCYRRNPEHFKELEHPHLDDLLHKDTIPQQYENEKSIILEQLDVLRKIKGLPTSVKTERGAISVGDVATFFSTSCSSHFKPVKLIFKLPTTKTTQDKLDIAAPYNIFFTTISDCPSTLKEDNSVTFQDLLCPSLGELKTSLQINFMIDIMWLMEQYQARGVGDKPLTAFFGYEFPGMKDYMAKSLPNVKPYFVPMKDPFGTHHSKMGIYVYTDDSIRVVISTANLYYEDWNLYAQGLWISPRCPQLAESAPDTDGAGPTGFKTNLLTYLKSYDTVHTKEWIDYVKRADFSEVKVFMVMSIPGKHFQNQNTGCHHQRVGDLLSRHCELPEKSPSSSDGPLSWNVIAQASSIGSLGKTPAEWLRGLLLRSLASHTKQPVPSNSNATLNVVFPSRTNVLNSFKGVDGGGCLPYGKAVHEKQKWFTNYLHQWKADAKNRSRSMPHIKTYCRVSPCSTKLAYFLISSANISKAAWGSTIQKKDSSTYVRSYEVGVLFLPKFFDEKYFNIKENDDSRKSGGKLFPFIYDIPLTSYGPGEEPWCQ